MLDNIFAYNIQIAEIYTSHKILTNLYNIKCMLHYYDNDGDNFNDPSRFIMKNEEVKNKYEDQSAQDGSIIKNEKYENQADAVVNYHINTFMSQNDFDDDYKVYFSTDLLNKSDKILCTLITDCLRDISRLDPSSSRLKQIEKIFHLAVDILRNLKLDEITHMDEIVKVLRAIKKKTS